MKIGIIGLGQMGVSYLMEAFKYAESISCYDIDSTKLENIEQTICNHKNPFNKGCLPHIDRGKIKCHFKLNEFLGELCDLVIVATHKETHAYYAITAMACGSHVLIEKPLCCTVAEAEEIKTVSNKLKKKAYVGFSLHGTPAFIELKKLIKNNIGNIKEYAVKRLGVVPHDYPVHVTADFDLLSHDTDFCLQMFGEPDRQIVNIISDRECIKSWKYSGSSFAVSMHGVLPQRHDPEFQYSFKLLCKDGTSYSFDSNRLDIIQVRRSCNTEGHIKLRTDISSCALILESVINSLDDDYDQFLEHYLSVENGYNCMKWLGEHNSSHALE